MVPNNKLMASSMSTNPSKSELCSVLSPATSSLSASVISNGARPDSIREQSQSMVSVVTHQQKCRQKRPSACLLLEMKNAAMIIGKYKASSLLINTDAIRNDAREPQCENPDVPNRIAAATMNEDRMVARTKPEAMSAKPAPTGVKTMAQRC